MMVHRRRGRGFRPKILLVACTLALAAFPGAVVAQFTDTFDTIDAAWVTNRYAPAGFASVNFDGDYRLLLTIGQTGSYSVAWDNVSASAVPEPAASALTVALAAFGLVGWRRRRAAKLANKASAPPDGLPGPKPRRQMVVLDLTLP